MDRERWKRIESLFVQAEPLAGEARAEFLKRSCADDPLLLNEVVEMLEAHRTERALAAEAKLLPEVGVSPTPSDPTLTESIGPYRILRTIGEGGMGVVFEAEQTEPVRRRVALKLIKWGMDTKEVLARFDSERQALALMSHPFIARVYDAGATSEGRPYFAMELVEGVPITSLCDRERLTLEQRLRLFVKVCEGVAHAHRKGIIHRDLKPSNVLAHRQDGELVPKIIDFGIAKAIDQRLTEQTLYTERGQFLGTPEYMSPEQASVGALDVDTRSDVYSLGVLLYRLLTGARPGVAANAEGGSLDEIRRQIRENTPPKPSTRVRQLNAERSQVAEQRRLEPASLAKRLRGDLDAITLKAIHKDRDQRYGSPSELAADVDRYLRRLPVQARAPNVLYEASRFVRRHRTAVAVAATALVGLVAFAVTVSVQSIRLQAERDRANRESRAAQNVSGFLTELFEGSDPARARGREVTVREILDRGASRMSASLHEEPTTRAQLLRTLGNVHRSLGYYEEATPLLEESWAILERELGAEARESLAVASDLATLYHDDGRYEESKSLAEVTLEAQRRLFGEEDLETVETLRILALAYHGLSRHQEAESLYERVAEIRRQRLGAEHPETIRAMNSLASVYESQRRFAEAHELLREALTVSRRTEGEDAPSTLTLQHNVAATLILLKRFEEAERLGQSALEGRRRVLGSEHPHTLSTHRMLAIGARERGDHELAVATHLELIEVLKRVVGPESEAVSSALEDLGITYRHQGRFAEAAAVGSEALAVRQRLFGEEHLSTLYAMYNLGTIHEERLDYGEAERLYSQALAIAPRVVPPDHLFVPTLYYRIACVHGAQDRRDEALEWVRKAIDNGWSDAGRMAKEPKLAVLRGLPAFEALLTGLGEPGEVEGRASAE